MGGPFRVCTTRAGRQLRVLRGRLKRLKQMINRVGSEIKDSRKLHHDNAPSHTASGVRDYRTWIGVATVPRPPYIPDLAPPHFFLFPKVKKALKGRHSNDVDEAFKGHPR